ncbi:protein kinase [Thermogemmatispora sp.]|uniref:serine/threonine-protein kinase n=1 Tax=Thermogemmatispora sp. TaxID=1968838 RepID=UPI0035E41FA9
MPEPENNAQRSQQSNGNRRRFGNYELVRRIDVGGMGEVYLARQRTAFGREVAIKIMRSDLVHDPIARQRFLREAEVNAHLKHEHILSLIEFGEEQGRLFFVTPYIEGGTLAQRLQRGPLPLPEVYRLFTALVQAVAYIHRRGVIHRDLKPSNVLLDRSSDGKVYVRLIDFGIATIQGQHAEAPLTLPGNEVGTLAYMAPERLQGVAAVSNDIYSLGVILYQMLTGQLPSQEQPRRRLPEPLARVVLRAIAERPKERFGSAEELLAAFEQAYRAIGAVVEESERSSSAQHVAVQPGPRQPAATSRSANQGAASRPSALSDHTPPEVMTLQRSEDAPEQSPYVPPARPPQSPTGRPPISLSGQGGFAREDYDAPTMDLGRDVLSSSGGPGRRSGGRPPRGRKNPLLALIFVTIALVLLLIGGLLFLEAPGLASASINISPRTATLSQVFTITASLKVKQVDTASKTIPARVLSESKTLSQQGATTGRKCTLLILDCKQSVDIVDQIRLANQAKQILVNQISQDLQRQLHQQNAQQVGDIVFSDVDEKTEPPIGVESSTVTVTLTEQGSVEYFLLGDVRSLVLQLLGQQAQQQLGAHAQLKTTQIGKVNVQSVDNQGTATLKVPAAALAQYLFSQDELESMKSHIKGLKVSQARTYLQKQPGVDPASIGIHLAGGSNDVLPDDPQRIQIIPVNPTNLPSVQLPSASGASSTTATAPASPTRSATASASP